MIRLMSIFVSIGIFSTVMPAFAKNTSVKSVSCASGKLNPSGTVAVGANFSDSQLKQMSSENGALLTTDTDAVAILKVGGGNNDGGACYNDGKATILIITFDN